MEIKYHSVYYSYHENNPIEYNALEDITLQIKSGKINGIIGSIGSGKTTFLELLNSLLLPTLGKIEIGNYQIEPKKKIYDINQLRFEIGFVFQNPKEQFFLPSVKKEIAFGLQQFNYKVDKIEKKIYNSLKIVGLNESYLNRDPLTLSNGEMRKVAIASVLAFNPNVLVFDEPTIGLDSVSKESLIKMLKMLKKRYHKTIIVVSHDIDFIHRLVDYLFVFQNGKMVLEGTKYDVFETENIEKYGIVRPNVMEFSHLVKQQKGIKLGYRDDINDLIKDIYRHVS